MVTDRLTKLINELRGHDRVRGVMMAGEYVVVSEEDKRSETTDLLINQYREVISNQSESAAYRWYITDTVFEQLHEENTPMGYSDLMDCCEYGEDGIVFQTEWGPVECHRDTAQVSDGAPDGAEVVARELNGDAVLIRRS